MFTQPSRRRDCRVEGLLTRAATTATFFLGLVGRLFFAASTARFRAVLLANAPRTVFGETATLLVDAISFVIHLHHFFRAITQIEQLVFNVHVYDRKVRSFSLL